MTLVRYQRDAEVAVLTIERPPANAMSVELLEALVEGIEAVRADPPGALVLSGAPGVFSAGADLKLVPGYAPEQQRAMVHGINNMALGLYGLPCPVVAAVTGHAIAGGLVLAVCADQLVASEIGRYGLTEIKVGVPYPAAAIGIVRAELAPHAARRLVFGNGLHDASVLLELGVFDEVLAPDAVLPRALTVARELAALPADSYAFTKASLRGETIARLRAAAVEDPLLERWAG